MSARTCASSSLARDSGSSSPMPTSLSDLVCRRCMDRGRGVWNSSATCQPSTDAEMTPSRAASARPPTDDPAASGVIPVRPASELLGTFGCVNGFPLACA
jgi:hypothetical protein